MHTLSFNLQTKCFLETCSYGHVVLFWYVELLITFCLRLSDTLCISTLQIFYNLLIFLLVLVSARLAHGACTCCCRTRGISSGLSAAICYIFLFAASKTYLEMEQGLQIYGSFLIFTAINILGFLFVYWRVPNTEGKTLVEIEAYFSR